MRPGLLAIASFLVAACDGGQEAPCGMQPGYYKVQSNGECYADFSPFSSDGTIASFATGICGTGCVPPGGCVIDWHEHFGTNNISDIDCELTLDHGQGTGECSGTITHNPGDIVTPCNQPLTLTLDQL